MQQKLFCACAVIRRSRGSSRRLNSLAVHEDLVTDDLELAAGVDIHVDELHAYLQTGAGLFRHDLGAFDQALPLGDRITVSYDK